MSFINGDRVKASSDTMEGKESPNRIATVVGECISSTGQRWTGILWDDEDDPDWFKTNCLIKA